MEQRQQIRNNFGKLLGTVVIKENGNQELTDQFSKILGRYDKNSNQTRDLFGKLIGTGNLLSMLIKS